MSMLAQILAQIVVAAALMSAVLIVGAGLIAALSRVSRAGTFERSGRAAQSVHCGLISRKTHAI